MQALNDTDLVTALMEWQVAEDAIACALKKITAILLGMKVQMVQCIQEWLNAVEGSQFHDSFKLGTNEATVSSGKVAHGLNEEGAAGSESSSQNQQHDLIQFQPQWKEKCKESYKMH
ncbi:hypothetical protein L208DRAFT_1377352 [Tricholoma matsutake]|nr:hypothetical protein L208DRAFT_1377352 [Tricholoma matsutake 945]